MSENLEPIEKVEPPCQIYYLQSSSGKVYRCYRTSEADKVIAHNKYKRCLAMARWCEATALWCYQAANTLPAGFHATLYGKPVMIEPDRLFNRYVLLTKWSARWREIAEKFKETK